MLSAGEVQDSGLLLLPMMHFILPYLLTAPSGCQVWQLLPSVACHPHPVGVWLVLVSRLFAFSLKESVSQTMEKALNRSSLALRKEAIVTGSSLVTSFLR